MDMEPGHGINTEMSNRMKENSPTSPLCRDLHSEISGGVLSGARSRTGRSLICRIELSRPVSLQV